MSLVLSKIRLKLGKSKYYSKIETAFPNKIICQRIVKAVFNSTLALIFCLIPKVRERLGNQPVMLPLVSVVVQPGKRLGSMIEGVIFYVFGLGLGNSWGLLGRFISQRILGDELLKFKDKEIYHLNYTKYQQALVVLAVFEMLQLFFQGYMRSLSHKFFSLVFPMFLVVHFSFMSDLNTSSVDIAKSFTTPFLFGIAQAILINITIFPEYGSSYLGNAAVNTFNQLDLTTTGILEFFTNGASFATADAKLGLSKLLKMKTQWAQNLLVANTAFKECSYEISYSYLSPFSLKKTLRSLESLSSNISALINSCQLEFALIHYKDSRHVYLEDEFLQSSVVSKEEDELLMNLLKVLKDTLDDTDISIANSLILVRLILGYSFDVDEKLLEPTLKKIKDLYDSDQLTVEFQEELSKIGIDLKDVTNFQIKNLKIIESNDALFERHIGELVKTIVKFESHLKKKIHDIYSTVDQSLSPSDELFLLSSFLINLKEFLGNLIKIMAQVKIISNKRKSRESLGFLRGQRIWFFKLNNVKQYFYNNSKSVISDNISLLAVSGPTNTHVEYDNTIDDSDQNKKPLVQETFKTEATLPIATVADKTESTIERFHLKLTNFFNEALIKCYKAVSKNKLHIRFGFQLTIALMVASLPMFIPKSRSWYIDIRGSWVGFVCTLSLEPSIGATFFVSFLRLIGVLLGSSWGLLSYVSAAHQTNPYVEVIITVVGAIPGYYCLLGTPYVKAAIIGLVSIYVVMLASIVPNEIGGSITLNWGKRCLAMLYGGTVALLVQTTVLPLRARDKVVDEVAFVVSACGRMELIFAVALEGEDVKAALTNERFAKFTSLSKKAKGSLNRAMVYKQEARREFRLKGSFSEIEKIFTEMIYILQQIVERMDNIALLRKQYGSVVIEELNSEVYPCRRQLAASISAIMRSISEALTNKTPLPQFLPSPRIAHRRLVEKVKDVLDNRRISSTRVSADVGSQSSSDESESHFDSDPIDGQLTSHSIPNDVLSQSFVSWSASTSATEEVIDFIEDLIELTQLLVGVNEFKYGFLSRTLYSDWAAKAIVGYNTVNKSAKLTKSNSHDIPEYPNDFDMESLDSMQNGDDMNPIGITSDIGMGQVEPTFSMSSRLSDNFRKRVNSFGLKFPGKGNNVRRESLGGYLNNEDEDGELPSSIIRYVSRRNNRLSVDSGSVGN